MAKDGAKVSNQGYLQWVGCEEPFERERGSDPAFQVWDRCTPACDSAGLIEYSRLKIVR
jgi:hypothetical protein